MNRVSASEVTINFVKQRAAAVRDLIEFEKDEFQKAAANDLLRPGITKSGEQEFERDFSRNNSLENLPKAVYENGERKLFPHNEKSALLEGKGIPVPKDYEEELSQGVLEKAIDVLRQPLKDMQETPASLPYRRKIEEAVGLLEPLLVRQPEQPAKDPFNNPKFEIYRNRQGRAELGGKKENALEFLQRVWGDYLKAFGAENDYLYQDQLKEIDLSLKVGLRNYCDQRGIESSDFVPIITKRIEQDVQELKDSLKQSGENIPVGKKIHRLERAMRK
jgi:hypothetical protein